MDVDFSAHCLLQNGVPIAVSGFIILAMTRSLPCQRVGLDRKLCLRTAGSQSHGSRCCRPPPVMTKSSSEDATGLYQFLSANGTTTNTECCERYDRRLAGPKTVCMMRRGFGIACL